MKKGNLTKYIIFLLCSILLEVLVFNGKAISTAGGTNQRPVYTRAGNTIYIENVGCEPEYLYVGVTAGAENGEVVPVTIRMKIQDEGNSEFYDLPDVTIYPLVEKSKYLPIHSYGAVGAMVIAFETDTVADIQVSDIIVDARVPWFISIIRIAGMFLIACLIWWLRPSSAIYSHQWTRRQKGAAVLLLVAANSVLFLFLVRSNPAFLEPVWPYHKQYHQLAVALSQGEVAVDVAKEETLAALRELENPYDSGIRMSTVPNAGSVWDICYYEGEFYVYFGIVPVLLFYLPYYLICGSAFPTWLGVFITGVGIVGGVCYLLSRIRRRWFPEMSFTLYLLFAAVISNCLNVNCAMLHADFYYLPILMALCFSLWGLGLMVSVANDWEQETKGLYVRIGAGALCLALTAGCRPQFLVGSFLLIPLFGPVICKHKNYKQTGKRLLAAALPYLVVAAGLMFYNAIRFGSVFDFGANYNLTTNDMTQRGTNWDRLTDGIFMYLFQPINCKPVFPFAEVTGFYSEYLGNTIRDWTFGGVFWSRPILPVLVCVAAVRKELSEKKLFGFTVLSMCLAMVVVVADTEMAGILNRYCTDFLWLLLIPAAIVLMQLLEKYSDTDGYRWLLCFVLIMGMFGVLYELAIAFRGSELIRDNVHRYYLIKSLFQ